MNAQLAVRITLSLSLLALVSCGGSPVGKVVPVSGKVINADDAPLKEGSIAFWPNKDKGNSSPYEAGATINADGTYEAFTKGVKGVPPGAYKVTVMAQTSADSTSPDKAKLLVPEIYTKKETTTLLIEVVENPSPGAYDLKLKPK
jgi:hypothetical protein